MELKCTCCMNNREFIHRALSPGHMVSTLKLQTPVKPWKCN